MMKEVQDYYFHKARSENYPARSIYKLKELDARFRLLRKGCKALDLGAAPGSWSIGCSEKIGPGGIVISCDIKPVATVFPANVRFFQEDVFNFSESFAGILAEIGPFDIVLSDMAPATTGSRFTDQARSHELAESAFAVACANLRAGGSFVVKIFMGPDVKQFEKNVRLFFGSVKTFKPKSSRAESKEIFLVGLDYRPAR